MASVCTHLNWMRRTRVALGAIVTCRTILRITSTSSWNLFFRLPLESRTNAISSGGALTEQRAASESAHSKRCAWRLHTYACSRWAYERSLAAQGHFESLERRLKFVPTRKMRTKSTPLDEPKAAPSRQKRAALKRRRTDDCNGDEFEARRVEQ